MDNIRDYESRINAAFERIAARLDGQTASGADPSELDALKAENTRLKVVLEEQTTQVQTLYDQLAAALAQGEEA